MFSLLHRAFDISSRWLLTSANTIMEGKLRRYRNAFCVAAPAIFNTTSMTGTVSTSNAQRASHLTSWAISPEGGVFDAALRAETHDLHQNCAAVSRMAFTSSKKVPLAPMFLHSTSTWSPIA